MRHHLNLLKQKASIYQGLFQKLSLKLLYGAIGRGSEIDKILTIVSLHVYLRIKNHKISISNDEWL